MLSSTFYSAQGTSSLTKSEALGDKEVFKMITLSNTAERVLLTKGTFGNKQLVGETSETPSGLTIGEDTSLE